MPPNVTRVHMMVTTRPTAAGRRRLARSWDLATPTATHEDLAWAYDAPLPESAGMKGLLCFDNEKVDLEVDGVGSASPRTELS